MATPQDSPPVKDKNQTYVRPTDCWTVFHPSCKVPPTPGPDLGKRKLEAHVLFTSIAICSVCFPLSSVW